MVLLFGRGECGKNTNTSNVLILHVMSTLIQLRAAYMNMSYYCINNIILYFFMYM